jgi:hypothetical protein
MALKAYSALGAFSLTALSLGCSTLDILQYARWINLEVASKENRDDQNED